MTRTAFLRDGFLVLREAIPPAVTALAREAVLAALPEEADAAAVRAWTQKTFVPELADDARLLALYRDSSARSFCEELAAPGALAPVATAQVQIRLPTGSGPQPPKQLHVDGLACPHLPSGTRNTFTLLVGVLLSRINRPQEGALEISRGGHEVMAGWLRAHSIEELPPGEEVPPAAQQLSRAAITGEPGDAVIVHHLTPHAAGANHGRFPRIMVYFRLRHVRHDDLADAALTDPWVELPGASSGRLSSSR